MATALGAVEVDVDDLSKAFGRELLVVTLDNASAVHQHIQLWERRKKALNLGWVTYVKLMSLGYAFSLLLVGRLDAGDVNLVALCGKRLRDSPTNAGAAANNDNNFHIAPF
jgi:hypothetical protein